MQRIYQPLGLHHQRPRGLVFEPSFKSPVIFPLGMSGWPLSVKPQLGRAPSLHTLHWLGVILPEAHASMPLSAIHLPWKHRFHFMRWAPSGLLSLHLEFQIKCEAASTEALVGYTQAFPHGELIDHSREVGWASLFTIRAAAGMLTLFPGKSSTQEPRRMVIGAAGAPGRLADRAPRKGGESVTIPHPRTEVPHVQATGCRPRRAECLWAQAGVGRGDVTACADQWIQTSLS